MKRRPLYLSLLALSLGIAGIAIAQLRQSIPSAWRQRDMNAEHRAVAAAPPTPGLDLQLRVVNANRDGKFTVEMRNTSEKPMRIWRTGNSWGEMNWRVFRVSKSGVETFFESPVQMFTKNTPNYVVIEPKSHITRELDLNGGNWCGRGHCSWWGEHGLGGKQVTFDSGDTVVISYDVRPSDESFKLNVWVGVTAATGTIH